MRNLATAVLLVIASYQAEAQTIPLEKKPFANSSSHGSGLLLRQNKYDLVPSVYVGKVYVGSEKQ